MTTPHPLMEDREDAEVRDLIRVRTTIRIMALRLLRDLDEAEEVAQETIVRVVRALREGRLADPSRLGAFARGTAHHVIVDTLRARRRRASVDDLDTVPASATTDPLRSLVCEEEAGRVRAALHSLSPADHELLRLSFFDDLTPAALATRLGEPAPRIRKRKQRALRRLHDAFQSAGRRAQALAPMEKRDPAMDTRPRALRRVGGSGSGRFDLGGGGRGVQRVAVRVGTGRHVVVMATERDDAVAQAALDAPVPELALCAHVTQRYQRMVDEDPAPTT